MAIIRDVGSAVREREFFTIAPDDSLRAACRQLRECRVDALAVLSGERLVGMLSEHDVIHRGIGADRRSDETQVAEVMTADPVTIGAGQSLAEAMQAMQEGGFRHLPVLEAGRLIGILSMRDIPTDYRLMLERYRESFGTLPAH